MPLEARENCALVAFMVQLMYFFFYQNAWIFVFPKIYSEQLVDMYFSLDKLYFISDNYDKAVIITVVTKAVPFFRALFF